MACTFKETWQIVFFQKQTQEGLESPCLEQNKRENTMKITTFVHIWSKTILQAKKIALLESWVQMGGRINDKLYSF